MEPGDMNPAYRTLRGQEVPNVLCIGMVRKGTAPSGAALWTVYTMRWDSTGRVSFHEENGLEHVLNNPMRFEGTP